MSRILTSRCLKVQGIFGIPADVWNHVVVLLDFVFNTGNTHIIIGVLRSVLQKCLLEKRINTMKVNFIETILK